MKNMLLKVQSCKLYNNKYMTLQHTLHKKCSFLLKVSSVNVTNLVTFTEETINGKFHFLCSDK